MDHSHINSSKMSGSALSNNAAGQYKNTDVPSQGNKTDMSMKKGMTRFVLNDEEQKKFLDYELLRPDLLDWDELKMSPNFAVKSYKDSVYRGEIVDSKRNGKGIITYATKRVYEGEWANDKRHGFGYEQFSNDNIYEGQYFDGKVQG